MNLEELINKYKVNYSFGCNHMENVLLTDGIFESMEWHTEVECETIYSYCYDGRRGLWVNVFREDGEVVCVQVCAGREGDDASITLAIDSDWLDRLAEENGTVVKKWALLCKVGNLQVDISNIVKNAISGYGTSHESDIREIDKVLS